MDLTPATIEPPRYVGRQRPGISITADVWPHPITAEGRTTRPVTIAPGTTLEDLVLRDLDDVDPDTAASVDHVLVPREAWRLTVLQDGQVVTLRTAPGDDVGRVLGQLFVIAAAVFVPGALGFATGTVGAALVSAGTLIVGGLIINALFPVRLPEAPQLTSPDPVYSLTGGANRARLYEPMPLVLGRHRIFPDLAAAEYTEFRGGEQYLFQAFHFGLGDIDIEDIASGSTELSSYEEATVQRAGADGRLTLVAGNVDTVSGADLEDTGWIERMTGANTSRIGIDLVAQLFSIDDAGETGAAEVTIQVRWSKPGTAAQTRTVTLENDDQAPYRRTLSYNIGSGTWTVRVRRTSEKSDSARTRDDVTWAALRSYQPDEADYTGQNRMAVRIRASGQLQGRLDRVSAIVHQKVPVWQGAAWTASRSRSRNPAAIFRFFALGVPVNGRIRAGAGIAANRIDHAGIGAWHEWCEAHDLTCDFLVTGRMTREQVLNQVAQCGRAAKSWHTGKLGVVYDDEDRLPSAHVTPGNIVAGSFRINYASEPPADEIVVNYIEPDLDWQVNSVRRTRPGLTGTPSSSVTVTARGVTERSQAAEECNLQAARQEYHRRRMSWEMGREARNLPKGTVAWLTHGLVSGGVTGRFVSGDGNRATLDREVSIGRNSWLLIRDGRGVLHQSQVNLPDGVEGLTRELVLATPLDAPLNEGGANPVDALWRLYDSALPPRKARIVGVEPVSDRQYRITAIDEVAAYYDLATSDLSVPIPALTRRIARVVAITVSERLIRTGNAYAVEVSATLTVAGDWRSGVIREQVNGAAPRTVATLRDGATEARWITGPSGTLTVTAVPGSEAAATGPALSVTHEILGVFAPPGLPGNFLIDVLGDGTRRFRWTPPADPDLAGVVIRYAAQAAGTPPAWGNMTELHRGHLPASPLETVEPPPGAWVFAARAIDTGGRLSDGDVRIVAELGPQRQGDSLLWECPSAVGWPGTITGGERSGDGRDAIESSGNYRWSDLSTWAAWETWARGAGNGASRAVTYATDPIDIGLSTALDIRWTGETVGDVAFEYRAGESLALMQAEAWAEYTANTTVTGRWFQLRWRLTGDGTEILSLDHLCYSMHAPTSEQKLLDQNTSSWAGSAAAGREVPVTLRLVTDLDVTLQSVGAGWSWTLDNKNNPTRIRIFDGSGNPADALVDVVVRGIQA